MNSIDAHCSLLNMNTHMNGNSVDFQELETLHVAGISSNPFVFYDAVSGNLKGFDVSLITTVANKLGMPISINVLAADDMFHFDSVVNK